MNFLIVSKNEENKEFAMKNKVWQTRITFQNIKVGDFGFIKVSGASKIEFIGVCESVGQELALRWPQSAYNVESTIEKEFTIRFRSIVNLDFKGGQTAIRCQKE